MDASAEGLAAAALSDVILQLFPAEAPGLLGVTFRAMAQLVAAPQLPAQVGPGFGFTQWRDPVHHLICWKHSSHLFRRLSLLSS